MSVNLQRVGFLAVIPDLLQECGASLDTVLSDAGLDADALKDPEAMITFQSMGLLIDACVARTGISHFGLLLGQRAGARSLGLIGELMANAPNLGAAMQVLVAHQHRHARGAVTYLMELGDNALFGYAIYQPDMVGISAIYDGAAAVAFEFLSNTAKRLEREEMAVHISRPEPEVTAPYRKHFACPIRFGSDFTGIAVPKSWLGHVLRDASDDRRLMLEAQMKVYSRAGPYEVVDRLQRWLTVGLLTGTLGRDDFADHVAMSRRTLNRRLAATGHSYQSILDGCRFELAKQLLANTPLGIGQISAIMRYAEHSEFTRAFTHWSGVAPLTWKKMKAAERGRTFAAEEPAADLVPKART